MELIKLEVDSLSIVIKGKVSPEGNCQILTNSLFSSETDQWALKRLILNPNVYNLMHFLEFTIGSVAKFLNKDIIGKYYISGHPDISVSLNRGEIVWNLINDLVRPGTRNSEVFYDRRATDRKVDDEVLV